MAHSFAVQAQLQIKGPPNLRPVIAQIKAGLSNINANIKLNLNSSTVTSVGNLNTKLFLLNKNLTAIQTSGKGANAILQQLATTFNSMQASAATVSASLGKINTSVAKVAQSTQSASKSVSQFGELIGVSAKKFIAFSVAASAIAGFVFSIQNAFRDAVKFQNELIKLAQVGGDSKGVIKGISDEVTRLATTLGVSSHGLIETAVTLRQAGLSATETKKALEALAKTELAPTFDSIQRTTEGAIAVMAQFKIKSKDLEGALGSINSISAKYAVESGDLIEAIRRSGGAFKAAGGDLNQFLALFTSVRATTRESAESIATGFRTIFARLQQPATINSLKQIGVSLSDMKGQFVGPYEAVKRLSAALESIPTSDRRFAQIVETIGGIRQVSKVIPLLKEFSTAQEALNVGLSAQGSLAKDAAIAQGSLIVRMRKLKEEFLDLFRVISEDTMVQAFVGSALSLASALIKITKALTPLVPLLTIFSAVKLGRNIAGFAAGVSSGVGRAVKFASGGSVPGSGSGDTVPAMLTPGEFVIKKSAAQAIGHDTLNTWNKYASGGIVLPKSEHIGQIALNGKPEKSKLGTTGLVGSKTTREKALNVLNSYQQRHPSMTNDDIIDIVKEVNLQAPVDTYVLDKKRTQTVFREEMAGPIFGKINEQINKYKLGNNTFEYDVAKDKSFTDNMIGGLFEAFLSVQTGLPAAGGTASFDFDIISKRVGNFAKLLEDQPFLQGYMDAKATRKSPGVIVKKAADLGLFNNKINAPALMKAVGYSPDHFATISVDNDKSKSNTSSVSDAEKISKKNLHAQMMASIFSLHRATGGPINPINGDTDTVPAMLTPGEFVINKQSAQKIGQGTLNRLNKYAKRGPVGLPGFSNGGPIGNESIVPPDLLDGFRRLGIEIDKIDLTKFIKGVKYVDDFSHFASKFPNGTQNIKGLFNTKSREIELRKGGSTTETLATLLHELTHAFDSAVGPRTGSSPFSSHVEGTTFNKAAKLAAATQDEGMLENYRKRLPGVDLSHEQLAFGASSYVRAKAMGTMGNDPDDDHDKFFNFFEKNILGKMVKAHPSPSSSHALVAEERPEILGPPPMTNVEIDRQLRRQKKNTGFVNARDEMFNEAIASAPPPMANKGSFTKFNYKAMDHTGKEVKGVVEAIDEAMAEHIIRQKNLFVTDIKQKKGSIFSRFMGGSGGSNGGPPNPPNSPNGPNDVPGAPFPLNRSKLGRGIDKLKGKIGGIGTIAGLAAPFLFEHALGTADKPGVLGTGGARAGSAIGGAVGAGSLAFAATGNPLIALGAAAIGAIGGLKGFSKELEDIRIQKMSDEFNKFAGQLKTQSGKSGLAGVTQKISDEINQSRESKASIFGSGGFKSLGIAARGIFQGSFSSAAEQDRAATDQETADKFGPLLDTVLSEFKALSDANPGKTMAELEKLNPELAHSKFVLATFNTESVRATTIAINNAAKQKKSQDLVDLTFTKLATSADELSQKISAAGESLEKNFARNAVGRGGQVSGGVDFFNVGALGGTGKELQEFSRVGGGIDQSKEIVKKTIFDAIKGGSLDKESIQGKISGGLQGAGLGEGAVGAFLKASIESKLSTPEGEKAIGNAQGDPLGAIKLLTEDFEKVRPLVEKANQDLVKAQQMFAQDAVAIAGQMDDVRTQQEAIDHARINATKNRAATLMRNNDTHFFDGRGGVITPEDQANELNTRFANESFVASQKRFGVNAASSANPAAILAQLKAEQGKLGGLKDEAKNAVRIGADPKDFSMKIAESTQRISYFQQALKNLATSTTVLEAAQAKLNTALEKEAADMAGRKKVGEERAFGSRADIMKNAIADHLVGVAAQQGHLENFTDEQRAMTFQRLQETSGVERNINGQRVTGQQIIDAISSQYAPESNIPKSMVNTPNGMRGVSNEVLGAQGNVDAIQGKMVQAAEALKGFNLGEIAAQTNEHAKAFDTVIQQVTASFDEFLKKMKANGLASGGMAKGTDTIPAMLSPGEFVVNARSTSANKDLLHHINNTKTKYAAEGGIIGISAARDATNKILEERDVRVKLMKIETQARLEANNKRQLALTQKFPRVFGLDRAQTEFETPTEDISKKNQLAAQARQERAKEIAKRVARRERLGLPEYVPVDKRVDNNPINAFNDPQAAQMRGEQLDRVAFNRRRTRAAQNLANAGNRNGSVAIASNMSNQGQGGGIGDAAKQFTESSRPLVDALNSFPRELNIKRDGTIQVVLNGAEVVAKMKGDLEKEVWAKIIETIQREVPKAVKKMPG